MRIGLNVGPLTVDLAIEEGIKGAAFNNAPQLLTDGVKATLAPIRDKGLEVCQIAHWMYNPLGPEREKQVGLGREIEKIIPLLPETGHPMLLLNAGNYDQRSYGGTHPNNFTDAALDDAARALVPIVKLAEKNAVTIVIEPFVQNVVSTPERFIALKEKIGSKAFMCNLDLCNFYDFNDMMHPSDTAHHVCQVLAGHYVTAHVKDLRMVPGVHIHIEEAPFGEGVSDWATAFKYFAKDMPADGWVTLEHAKTREDALLGLRNMRAVATRAGVTLS